MGLVVRAFPLTAGGAEALEAFAEEVRTQKAEQARDFFARHNVERETWHVQDTPMGPWVIGVTQLSDDPQAVGQRYAASVEAFDAWFKAKVLEITGVDVNEQPLGPPTRLVFDTADAGLAP